MNETYETIEFDIQNQVAVLTLNRPESANAMNLKMSHELMTASIVCDENPAVRAVVITGAGKMFCAGGDLAEFASHGDELTHKLKEMTVYLHGAISRFARMDAPVICAVNGTAAGAGMSLAMSGDLVLAAESAKFTMAYTAAGLSPDGSSTYFLPKLIGVRKTKELMLTNRRLTAEEAEQWGLVNQVVSNDTLVTETLTLAAQLSRGPTRAYGAVKSLLNDAADSSLETQMELEARMITDMARSHDGQEGIAAFLGKRKPEFSGS